MSLSWHPEDSDWSMSSEDGNLAVAPCIVLDRPFIVSAIFPQTYSDVVAQQPHIVLACSAYDDDEDYEE